MSEIIREEENDLTSKNYIVIVDLVDWETDRLIASGCGSQYAQILAIRTMAKSLFPPVDARCVEQFLKGEHEMKYTRKTADLSDIREIGGIKVEISEGQHGEMPEGVWRPGSRKYQVLYDLLPSRRPEDPPLKIRVGSRDEAELLRTTANGMSCPPRGSVAKKRRHYQFSWPLAVRSSWKPDSEFDVRGPGVLWIEIYSRS